MSKNTIATMAAIIGAALVTLLLLDTGPNVPVAATLTLVACAAVWAWMQLGRALALPLPSLEQPDEPGAPPDLRTTTLRQALAIGNANSQVADRVYRQLVAAVDEELRATHAIDRASDPEAARRVLEPELYRFVADPDEARNMNVRSLERIVTQIEQL